MIAPQWFGQILGEGREHDVQANTDSLLFTCIGIDGVLQVRRKDEECPGLHSHDDMVRIFGCEVGHRRLNDSSLAARVMERNGVRTWMRAEIVDATQIVVGMVVHSMRGARGQNCGPACADLEVFVADSQEAQNPCHRAAHARHEIAEILARVESVDRLPPVAGRKGRQGFSDARQCPQNLCVDPLVQLWLELDLPDERWEHRNHVRT